MMGICDQAKKKEADDKTYASLLPRNSFVNSYVNSSRIQ